ncbi:MAG: energy transducer TonB [Bacteroidales bacterium]|nr:energy transducer TonB [Bacteroidales bacterium]
MKIRKSKKTNLENKRFIFFQIGLILSLTLIFTAFEWKSEDNSNTDYLKFKRADVIETIVDITVHKKKERPKPIPVVTPIFTEVEDDEPIDEELEFSSEVTGDTKNSLDNIFEKKDEEPEVPGIFTVVEKMPSFPGGMQALYKYLAVNIKYPKAAAEAGIQGPVYMEFVVWKDGSIRMTNVARGIGGGCDEEAFRVISQMPAWSPGLQRSIPVNVKLSIPVNFKLTN